MNTILAGVIPFLVEIALVLASTAVGAVSAYAARWLRLQSEEALRKPLLDLVDALAAGVRARVSGMATGGQDAAVRHLADHIERSYPDRLAALKVDRAQVENMFRVRLGLPPEARP